MKEEKKDNLRLTKLISPKKRVGRGRSGKGGKTAGRGTKGAKSRSGKPIPSYFEGGQTPLIRRLPKKTGFQPKERVLKVALNLDQIERAFKANETVSPQSLIKKNLIRIPKRRQKQKIIVKILSRGKLTKSLKFQDCQFSKNAKKIISQ